MIRKQIYLRERQQEIIRTIATARGVSEAEVIREAIDTEREQRVHDDPLDAKAWKRALKIMRSTQTKKRVSPLRSSRMWNRGELYEERLKRYGRSTR